MSHSWISLISFYRSTLTNDNNDINNVKVISMEKENLNRYDESSKDAVGDREGESPD